MFEPQPSHGPMMRCIKIFSPNIYIGNSKSLFECIGPLCVVGLGSSVGKDLDTSPEGHGFNPHR